VIAFEASSDLFKTAKGRDKYLWNFHSHHVRRPPAPAAARGGVSHGDASDAAATLPVASCLQDAPYPSADSNWELVRQIVVPTSAPAVALTSLAVYGWIPLWGCVVLGVGIGLGPFSQFTHFLSHARGRGLVQSRVLCFMQDWHIILHPETHRSHHVHFDRDFCILNGWGNPLVNRLRRLCSHVGLLPKVAPTVTTRNERAAMSGGKDAAKLTQKAAAL
jgi:hypothetical protein